jgi:hypothetical protein
MYICDFCNSNTEHGQAEKLVVTEWRLKTYASKKLPPLPGTSAPVWTKAGTGYEAAVVKRSCTSCDKKNAPIPSSVMNAVMIPASVILETAAEMGV